MVQRLQTTGLPVTVLEYLHTLSLFRKSFCVSELQWKTVAYGDLFRVLKNWGKSANSKMGIGVDAVDEKTRVRAADFGAENYFISNG